MAETSSPQKNIGGDRPSITSYPELLSSERIDDPANQWNALLKCYVTGEWTIYSPDLEQWMNKEGRFVTPSTLFFNDVPTFKSREAAMEAWEKSKEGQP